MVERPDLAIEARHVGVRFNLRLNRRNTFRRTVGQWLTRRGRDESDEFWALRGVSFEVRTGEVLGVVGRNGSGKSTLLLTIARILRPDTGYLRTYGSVSTLLTLGAGFEQELTGRENIYLNGAFLGLSKRDMDDRLADIVEFSELGRFIDVPLKKYSSGMRARLGFSIAAHIDPDILLLDEVLSVGDSQFRTKSQQMIRQLMQRAKAIVIVTHDMNFVRESCTTALWLHQGAVAGLGPAEAVVDRYLEAEGSALGAAAPSGGRSTAPQTAPQ